MMVTVSHDRLPRSGLSHQISPQRMAHPVAHGPNCESPDRPEGYHVLPSRELKHLVYMCDNGRIYGRDDIDTSQWAHPHTVGDHASSYEKYWLWVNFAFTLPGEIEFVVHPKKHFREQVIAWQIVPYPEGPESDIRPNVISHHSQFSNISGHNDATDYVGASPNSMYFFPTITRGRTTFRIRQYDEHSEAHDYTINRNAMSIETILERRGIVIDAPTRHTMRGVFSLRNGVIHCEVFLILPDERVLLCESPMPHLRLDTLYWFCGAHLLYGSNPEADKLGEVQPNSIHRPANDEPIGTSVDWFGAEWVRSDRILHFDFVNSDFYQGELQDSGSTVRFERPFTGAIAHTNYGTDIEAMVNGEWVTVPYGGMDMELFTNRPFRIKPAWLWVEDCSEIIIRSRAERDGNGFLNVYGITHQ